MSENGLFTSNWLLNVKNILTSSGFDCVWESESFSSKDFLCKNIEHYLQETYIEKWRTDLESSSKSLFYSHYKHTFEMEKYIQVLPDMYILSLVKFRSCNHKLEIEIGRHNGIQQQNRKCKACNMNEIGDEYHFIFECPAYADLRKKFLPRKYLHSRSMFTLCQLMSNTKKCVMLSIAEYFKSCKVV